MIAAYLLNLNMIITWIPKKQVTQLPSNLIFNENTEPSISFSLYLYPTFTINFPFLTIQKFKNLHKSLHSQKEACFEPWETSVMELFAKMVNN